jgi:hypothetical protein
MFLRAQLKRTYALQRFSTTLTKQSVSNIWIELRKESLNIPKIMETMQQQPTVKLDHTLSKKLITTILSTNSRHYLEILWSNVNQYQMYKSPLYAFLFDQIVKARMSGDLNFVRKMLEIALNSPESEISEFYKQWHEMEQNSPLYIDWIRIMPLTESIFILEDTWNLILTGYVQTKRFLAWKIYDYLVKSNRLRIRTSAYFLQTVKHQRKEFNKVFSDLLNIERHTWDQFSCQSLMETTCQVYRFKKALELLEIFKSIGKDDLSVYVMLLMKLVKREFFIDANLVLDQLKEKNFEWSKEAWFVVANYYASAGFEEKYHETIQYILDTYGSSPETFGLELNAIYKSNEQNELKAEQLLAKFDEMVSSGTLSNPVIMNLLVQAFGELVFLF